jgi:hypothetical protein
MKNYILHDSNLQVETCHCHVDALRELLGYDVTLIPVKPNTKIPAVEGWPDLTADCMDDPRYLARLRRGNIGVSLGAPSSGLCTVDIDDEAFVEPFLRDNPLLAETTRTRRARGCNFWIRLQGEYPPPFKIKSPDGKPLGEFRSTGNQTVIHGTANGIAYRFVNRVQPVTMAFEALNFPKQFTHTQPTFSSHPLTLDDIRSHLSTSVPPFPSVTCPDFEVMIQATLPTGEHQSHPRIFDLARRLKGLEKRTGASMEPVQLKAIFKRWHELALEHLRSDQSFDEYFFEFLDAMESVRYPAGEAVLAGAWERAKQTPPPPEADQIEDEGIRLLAALCRELQLRAGDHPFILPARITQQLFRHNNPMRSWRWLEGLCRLGILQKVKAGSCTDREPNEYKFLFKDKSQPTITTEI